MLNPKPDGGAPEMRPHDDPAIASTSSGADGRDSARSVSEDGTRPSARRRRGRSPDRAVSTTCPVLVTEPQAWEFLSAGVDSLDVGLHIDWSDAPPSFFSNLTAMRIQASGTVGIPFYQEPPCLIHPSGKPPIYSFHLESPGFHLYLNRCEQPQTKTPNGYVCLNSRHLWQWWIPESLRAPCELIDLCDGRVFDMKPSRVDLCADFYIPGGLSAEFLERHRCSGNLHQRNEGNGKTLESYYLGDRSSPLQCRIYDKGKEIHAGKVKYWFQEIWERDCVDDVWRVEFQLRRPVLKKFKIHCIDQLIDNLAGLWKYCTEDWLTLRLRDRDSNVSRCPIHPWWQSVIDAGSRLGDYRPLEREQDIPSASSAWYVSQISGCLSGYAVRRRLPRLDAALKGIRADIEQYWQTRSWKESYFAKCIKLGIDPLHAATQESDDGTHDFQI